MLFGIVADVSRVCGGNSSPNDYGHLAYPLNRSVCWGGLRCCLHDGCMVEYELHPYCGEAFGTCTADHDSDSRHLPALGLDRSSTVALPHCLGEDDEI